MANEALSTWNSVLTPHLPGIGQAFQDQLLLETVRDFLTETRMWKVAITPVSAVANTARYAIAPAGITADIVLAEELYFNGVRLYPKSPDQLVEMHTARDWSTIAGTPVHYFMDELDDSIVLVPHPDANLANALTGRVSVMPTLSAATIPDFLRAKFDHPIKFGALARAMVIKGRPWTNPQMAAVYQAQYTDGRAAAKWAAWKGNTRARPRVKANPF